MAELLDEDLLPFAAGIRSLPGRPHISTGYRFITKGSHGVILETILVGGRRYTTRQALRRFVARVTAAADTHELETKLDGRNEQADDDGRIERDLDAAGL